MAYVLVPPLPPGVRSSDYMPVKQQSRTRQRQLAAKEKARAGDNEGSKEIVHVPQVAFENNWPGADCTSTGPMGNKAAKETVVVVDDEDDEEEEGDKSKVPMPLDQALAAAFTHNPTSPNVVASASAPAATTARRSLKETRAEASRDSTGVEVVIPLPTKRARTHAHVQENDSAWQTNRNTSTLTTPKLRSLSMRRANNGASPSQAAITPHRTSTPPAIYTSISVHTSTPESTPPPQEQSSSFTPPDVNSLASLLLTILPEPACTRSSRAQIAIRQGFCYEGAAVGAHGLRATSPAAEPSPVSDRGACAITTNSASATDPDDLQDASLDLDCDLDILMDFEAGPADAHGVEDDVVPPHPPPPLLRTVGTHDHPDGHVLGFVILEHDDVDHSPGAGVDIGRAGTDTGACEYADDGTIDPSVLGDGGNLSPGKLGDNPSSPVRGFDGVQPSRATDEDDEEEEDFMGMSFENTSDDDFVPPSGFGKGKGRVVVVDGVVELSESIAAAPGSMMRRKSGRKELADQVVEEDNDSDDDRDDDDGPCASPELTFDRSAEDFNAEGRTSPNMMAGGAVGSRAKVAPIAPRRSPQRKARATTPDGAGSDDDDDDNNGYTARVVPVSQPTSSPAATTTTPSAPASITASPYPNLRSNSSSNRNDADMCLTGNRARRGGGSCPLRILRTTSRSNRKEKGKGRQRAGSVSLTLLDDDDDDDGDEDGNLDEGGNADADADHGIWPGWYMYRLLRRKRKRGSRRRRWSAHWRCVRHWHLGLDVVIDIDEL
ncbi:hypothetical protein EDB83DRAFT_2674316 [Lactarius deliciosus]|nr:hypothetical protein EDB83DRAFT_2674316 [Lactarius deliciosus]